MSNQDPLSGTVANQTREPSAACLLGVPEVASAGRERLVDVAIELFYRQGFHGVGLDQVIAAAGVTKTTFYKHFESRDDLVVAAIAKRDQWERRAWSEAARKLAGEDARAQLLALFDVLDIWFNDPAFHGCIFVNAAVEHPDPADPIHQAAAEHKLASLEWYRRLANEAGLRDPDVFADRYNLLVEGTLVVRHVQCRNDVARSARRMAELLIGMHE